MWLSFSMTMLDKSCRCGSIPPTIIPYFSTSLKPGVVLRVPATLPFQPDSCATSLKRLDLRAIGAARYVGACRTLPCNLTYTVAIPLHRASVLSATRSPRSSCLALPRTTATFVFASYGRGEPSG